MSTPRHTSGAQIGVAAGVLFFMYLGLMILTPIIAPLSRVLHLAEWQIGAVMSVAALVIALASPAWGRLGGRWGRRRVLLATTSAGTLAMVTFAALTQAGLRGLLGATAMFAVFVVTRGVWFGLCEAAILPNVQAYVAETVQDPAERVRGMAAVGAAQSLSMVVGSAAGGLLATGGTLVPLWITPALMTCGIVLVAGWFRAPAVRRADDEAPSRLAVGDRRSLPFLLIAFGAFTALNFMQMLAGFLVQDRLRIGVERTALLTGVVLLVAGVGLFLAQAVVVPRTGWAPARLIRFGLATAGLGFLLMVPDLGLWGLIGTALLIGLGLGLTMPGISAGASLAVGPGEQGAVAGLVNSVLALTMIVSPVVSTALYAIAPQVPLVISAVICALTLALAVRLKLSPAAPRDLIDDAADALR